MNLENAIETVEYQGYTIGLFPDNDPMNVREECDNLGHMAAFHDRYDLGDDYKDRPDGVRDPSDFLQWLDENEDQVADIIDLYLYDHSGLYLYSQETRQGVYLQHEAWDSGQIGFIYVMKDEVRKEYHVKRISKKLRTLVHKVLLAEIKDYSQYIAGDVVGYVIFKDDEEIDDIGSACWGYYDQDEAITEAKSIIDGLVQVDQAIGWNQVMVEQEVIS